MWLKQTRCILLIKLCDTISWRLNITKITLNLRDSMGTIFNGSCRVFQIHDDSLSIIDSEYRIRVITQIRSLQKCVIYNNFVSFGLIFNQIITLWTTCFNSTSKKILIVTLNSLRNMEEEEEKEELYFFVGLD